MASDNNGSRNRTALVGRVLIASMFIPSGLGKIFGFAAIVGYIASHGVPLPEICAAVAVAVELGLGLALLVGWQARQAAWGLAIFVAVVTPIFPNFWALPRAEAMLQMQSFIKNIAVIGGLLLIAAFGSGRFSLDGRPGRP